MFIWKWSIKRLPASTGYEMAGGKYLIVIRLPWVS
jgi:hypothetical protein